MNKISSYCLKSIVLSIKMCLRVYGCCFCMSLDVGTKVISIITTVLALMSGLLHGSAALVPQLPPARILFYCSISTTSAIQCAAGCLMIYGVFKKSPKLLYPWLVVTWVVSVALLGVTIVGMVVLTVYPRYQETNQYLALVMSAYFTYAAILFYFASVVSSRKEQMIQEKEAEFQKLSVEYVAVSPV